MSTTDQGSISPHLNLVTPDKKDCNTVYFKFWHPVGRNQTSKYFD